ncbi:MAG: hypothetical protein AAGK04_13785 [Planctomycetota bacterium]
MPVPVSIGVEIGSRALGAVATDRAGRTLGRLRLTRETSSVAPSESDLARLASALRRRGWVARSAWAVAPREATTLHGLTLPPPETGAPLDKLARAEVARIGHRSEDSFELAWWLAPMAHRRGESVLATAAVVDHDTSTAVLDGFESVGLSLRGLLPSAWALVAGAREDLPTSGLGVLLDVGWGRSSLVAVSGDAPAYERRLSSAFGMYVRSVAERLDLSDAEALRTIGRVGELEGRLAEIVADGLRRFGEGLAAELDESIGYLRSLWPDESIGQIVLSGAEASGLDDWLMTAIGLSVISPTRAPASMVSAYGASLIAGGCERRAAA